MGRFYKDLRGFENPAGLSVKSYYNAIRTLHPVQREFFRGYRRKKEIFDEKIRPIYLELTEIILDQAKRVAEKDRNGKLKSAIDIMESLKISELENYFEDECMTVKSEKKLEPENLSSGTAVIYPISFEDHLALLSIFSDGIRYIDIPADSGNIRKQAIRLRERIQDFSKESRIIYYAKALYDLLIRPAEDELTAHKTDTLVIVPDGVLRLIPFAVLHDGNQYLTEKYAVVTVPGITLTDSEPIISDKERILLTGLSESRDGFSPLYGVSEELEGIKTFTDGKILQDKDFTRENLETELKRNIYPVIHIATHGRFGSNSDDTFLLTYNSRLTMADLEKLINIRRFRKERTELLTLSACQTALGDERAVMGLAGIALKAGVRSSLATLWNTDDNAASLMLREFYRGLRHSESSETSEVRNSKAESLQHAQKALIAHRDYHHPFYWAAFLLTGDWL